MTKNEPADYELEISPVEQSYSQTQELQQNELEITNFNKEVDQRLAEK